MLNPGVWPHVCTPQEVRAAEAELGTVSQVEPTPKPQIWMRWPGEREKEKKRDRTELRGPPHGEGDILSSVEGQPRSRGLALL